MIELPWKIVQAKFRALALIDDLEHKIAGLYTESQVNLAMQKMVEQAAMAAEGAWTDVASLGACKMAADCVRALATPKVYEEIKAEIQKGE